MEISNLKGVNKESLGKQGECQVEVEKLQSLVKDLVDKLNENEA